MRNLVPQLTEVKKKKTWAKPEIIFIDSSYIESGNVALPTHEAVFAVGQPNSDAFLYSHVAS